MDLLKALGAAVAVVASLGAVAVVVEQFTLRARLRKTEAWATAALKEETGDERVAALNSLRLDATARIVAGTLMPARFFAEGALMTGGALAVTPLVVPNDTISLGGGIALVFVQFVGLGMTARRAIRLYLERCRVASEYRLDRAVREPERGLMEQMEGGTLVEFLFAAFYSAGVTLLALAVGRSLWQGEVGALAAFLGTAGVMGAFGTLDLVRLHARKRYPMR